MPPTDETTAVLDELESPNTNRLSDLRVDTAPGLDVTARIAVQVDQLSRLIEGALIVEGDANLLSGLSRMQKKCERAKADADEARQLLRRSGRALREAQALGRAIFEAVGRTPPSHLEDVPGQSVALQPQEPENVTE